MLCATHKLDLCQDNKTVALRVTNYYRDHADNEYKYNYKYRLNTSSWSTITTPVFQTADEPAYVLCEKSAISIKILTNCSELYMTCSSEHRRPSWTNSEVSEDIYVDHPQHSVELENTEILTTEPRWFERGVKEDTVKEPWTLAWTKMGWGAICTLVWDNIIKKKVHMKAHRPRREGASSPSRTTSPTTSPECWNWRSWQVSGKVFVSWTL